MESCFRSHVYLQLLLNKTNLFLVKDAIHKANGSVNVPIARKLLQAVKDAHAKSEIHDQLIEEKEKQQALQKRKEDDQKRQNEERKEIDLRIRY